MSISEILLWVDVETTGIDLTPTNRLLEIAMVPTSLDSKFIELEEPFSEVIYHGKNITLSNVSPYVLSMHAKNGLWEASRSANEPSIVYMHLEQIIDEWGLEDKTVYLAGRSVHFDRGWLEYSLPPHVCKALNLSHRHFDLSSIKTFAGVTGVTLEDSDDAELPGVDVG